MLRTILVSRQSTRFYKDDEIQSLGVNYDLSNKKSFDFILDQIGYGVYQLRLYLAMGLFGMTDGAEVLVLSLLLPFL